MCVLLSGSCIDIIHTQLFDNRISHVGLLTHFTHTHTHTHIDYGDVYRPEVELEQSVQTLHRRDAGSRRTYVKLEAA